MKFDYRYYGNTAIDSSPSKTDMSFAPDTSRTPTYFLGELGQSLEFREAMSALHDVVVSDLRFKPKDKTDYKAWAAQRDAFDLAAAVAHRAEVVQRIRSIQEELSELNRKSQLRSSTFESAKRRYFDYLYQKDRDAWFVLDPVITVHPDELFFECFSQDESSYGRVGVNYEAFRSVDDFGCGTTNVDYSAALYDEFQKIRRYKTTRFEVDPSGFAVNTQDEDAYKEVKIDLPDSWVRGFLQVSSAMTLPAVSFELHPMDVHNLCFVLRRHREKQGPRALRYKLEPGAPVRIFMEPWNLEIPCPRSIYKGARAYEMRVWGRRRLHQLERLIPVARRFTVHLLGQGLPSFYVADLGAMTFTLGLSGWTANDWSTAGNFDLLAPRAEVDSFTQRRVFDALKQHWFARPDDLAKELNLDRALVLGALGVYTQAGRAIFDLHKGVYRLRELSREPLPMQQLRFANEREQQASALIAAKAVQIRKATVSPDGSMALQGTVRARGQTHEVQARIDADQRLVQAHCNCYFFQENKLYKGPCEHVLAVRMQQRLQTN